MSVAESLDSVMEVEDDTSSTYLTLDLGEQILGIEVRHVREILDMQKITRLPNAPMDVQGVVDVRGASVPIIDLKNRLGILPTDVGAETRIVVIEIEAKGSRKPVGILADRVRNVEQIGAAEIEAVPDAGIDSWDARILEGLWRRGLDLVALIDLDQIFGKGGADIDLSAGAGLF